MELAKHLPFARGSTMSDWNVLSKTLGASTWLSLAGEKFFVPDTQHATGQQVGLILLKNGSSALTTENRFLEFSVATAKYFGSVVTGYNTTANGIVVALDDAYPAGKSIPAYDLFWGVFLGPVNVKTEATSVNLSAGDPVASDASGYVDGAAATAGSFVAGTIDADSTSTATAVLIHMAGNLSMPPAAG